MNSLKQLLNHLENNYKKNIHYNFDQVYFSKDDPLFNFSDQKIVELNNLLSKHIKKIEDKNEGKSKKLSEDDMKEDTDFNAEADEAAKADEDDELEKKKEEIKKRIFNEKKKLKHMEENPSKEQNRLKNKFDIKKLYDYEKMLFDITPNK